MYNLLTQGLSMRKWKYVEIVEKILDNSPQRCYNRDIRTKTLKCRKDYTMTIKEVMACATEDYIRVRLDWIEYEMRNMSNMTAYEQASAKHKCRKWSREIKDYIDKEVR